MSLETELFLLMGFEAQFNLQEEIPLKFSKFVIILIIS